MSRLSDRLSIFDDETKTSEHSLAEKKWTILPEHTGQTLHCLLPVKTEENKKNYHNYLTTIIKTTKATKTTTLDIYKEAFQIWQEATKSCAKMEATTSAPLAIGLGNESPYEVGLTLHHTYGVPYLPGTALKGLARRAAQYCLADEDRDKAFKILFGSDAQDNPEAGHITFFDGWMDCSVTQPLQQDVITVHHPEYYQKGDAFPTDFDDPNPVQFISVRPEVKFHLRIGIPYIGTSISSISDQQQDSANQWVKLAIQLVKYGLTHLGLGGKTNAGYGYFRIDQIQHSLTRLEKEELEYKKAIKEAKDLAGKIRQWKNAQAVRDNFHKALQDIKELPNQLRSIPVEALEERIDMFDLEKKFKI